MFSPEVSYSWGLETVPRTIHQDWDSGLELRTGSGLGQDSFSTYVQDWIRTHSGLMFRTGSGLTQDSCSGLDQDWPRTHIQDWVRTESGLTFRTGSGLAQDSYLGVSQDWPRTHIQEWVRTGSGLTFRMESGLDQDSHSGPSQNWIRTHIQDGVKTGSGLTFRTKSELALICRGSKEERMVGDWISSYDLPYLICMWNTFLQAKVLSSNFGSPWHCFSNTDQRPYYPWKCSCSYREMQSMCNLILSRS